MLEFPLIRPRLQAGIIPANGILNTTLPIPDLPPLGTERWYVQALHVEPGGDWVMGPVRALTLLDSAW